MKHLLRLSYDGTAYYGWQKTKTGLSIEELLENTLVQILSHPINLDAASRTDRGVHAHDQVVTFTSNNTCENIVYTLNRMLPADIQIISHAIAPDTFHPSCAATNKTYEYTITNTPFQSPFKRHFSWHIPAPLDVQAMKKAAEALIGKQDFSRFENVSKQPSKNPICTLFSIEIDGQTITLTGDRFLYKMARNIVGYLIYSGKGRPHPMTAPAHGLTLKKVYYQSDLKHSLVNAK